MIGTEKEVPGLITMSWVIEVVKNLDTGGLGGSKDKYFSLCICITITCVCLVNTQFSVSACVCRTSGVTSVACCECSSTLMSW